jgi:hypothetical protein
LGKWRRGRGGPPARRLGRRLGRSLTGVVLFVGQRRSPARAAAAAAFGGFLPRRRLRRARPLVARDRRVSAGGAVARVARVVVFARERPTAQLQRPVGGQGGEGGVAVAGEGAPQVHHGGRRAERKERHEATERGARSARVSHHRAQPRLETKQHTKTKPRRRGLPQRQHRDLRGREGERARSFLWSVEILPNTNQLKEARSLSHL